MIWSWKRVLPALPPAMTYVGWLPSVDKGLAVDCSVVIVHRNASHRTVEGCLQACRLAAERHSCEVFVVDQGVDPLFPGLIKERYPEVVLRSDPSDRGYSASNNQALLESHGRYLLLLNDDVVLSRGAIDRLVDWMEVHPRCGYAGPRLLLADGWLDRACRRSFPTPLISLFRLTGLSALFPRSRYFGRYNLGYLPEEEAAPVEAVVGACMLVRRQAAADVGVLDECYFMYGEDLDWCFRLHAAGWEGWYVPQVLAVHLKRSSSRQRPVRTAYEFYRAMMIFFRRHYAQATPPPVTYVILVGILLRGGLAVLRAVGGRGEGVGELREGAVGGT
ncbi:MAG: glycosyltransferase family 2 protein [Chloroflexi bacterium]|nr:glycosyltransferase family 2 protein [Chloroflexota bacterium]